MRLIRYGLAGLVFLLIAGPGFTKAYGQQGQAQGQAQAQGGQGRGGRGGGGGGGRATEPQVPDPVDPDVDSYVNKEDLFTVSVPCKFAAKDITWESEYGSTLPGHVYSCNKDAEQYSMTVINYTDIEKIHKAQEHTEAASGEVYWRLDLHASIAYAATKLRNEAAKVTYDAFHYIDLISGHELQYTLPNGNRTYAGIYLHEARLYIMKATVPPNSIPPLLFTQSLGIIKPDGSRIRYQTLYVQPW